MRGYTNGIGDGNDHHDGALFPSMRELMGLSGQGSECFGFEGSTGAARGPGELKCFQGLGEGFRKL